MNSGFLKINKAAFIYAAFLFIILANREALSKENQFETIKIKATELLLEKKKESALQVLKNYINNESGQNKTEEAIEFQVKIAQKFIFREAQEAYENSINLTLDNMSEAIKSNNRCLQIEPLQLECLIQKTRLDIIGKNNRNAAATAEQIKELVAGSKYENWLTLFFLKKEPEFKNRMIIKKIPDKKSDENLVLLLLELDRCFYAKNYSRAKDLIIYFEKHYSEWPDLVFYKYKINIDSAEEKPNSNSEPNPEQLLIYNKKCKSLSKTIARKFRYDFELCMRGI